MAIGFGSSLENDYSRESFQDGYSTGEADGRAKGFNQGIDAAKKFISQHPDLNATLTEELYQGLEKLKCR